MKSTLLVLGVVALSLPVGTWGQTCTQGTLSVVSAADYGTTSQGVAPGSLVTMFAPNIATAIYTASDQSPALLPTTLGGVSATVTDASGKTLPISLIAVAPSQVNALIPEGLQAAQSNGVVNLTTSSGSQVCGIVEINTVVPSIFTADNTGGWLAAAQVVITHANGTQTVMDSIAQYSATLVYNGTTWSHWVPIPINLGSSTDVAVLELFGTGIRGAYPYSSAEGDGPGAAICPNAICDYAGQSVGTGLTVLYAGPQGLGGAGSFYGLDQVNIVLPQSQAGSGVSFIVVSSPTLCPCTNYPYPGWVSVPANGVQIDIQ